MHVIFYAYGIREHVDNFLKWLETRQVFLPFENPKLKPNGPKTEKGELLKSGYIPVNVGVRYGIFGTYEATFPEFAKDEVLTLLRAGDKFYGYTKNTNWENFKVNAKIEVFRKLLDLEKVPEFQIKNTLFMPDRINEFVRIVVVGVRHDKIITDPNGLVYEGI